MGFGFRERKQTSPAAFHQRDVTHSDIAAVASA